MSDFHVATNLHASSVNALETTLNLGLEVSGPAIATERMTAAHCLLIVFLEELIADCAVASVLVRETHVHFRVLRD